MIVSGTSAYVSLRQHKSAYVSIRQHTSEYVSIRQELFGRPRAKPVCPVTQLLRCQNLYFCTSNLSELSTQKKFMHHGVIATEAYGRELRAIFLVK
jgi:hypothetical protein